jgi:hypothetical protein
MDRHQTIREIAAMLRIAHHIPGRVRLKLEHAGAGLAQGLAEAERFIQSAAQTDGIRKVTLNALARSCLVEYDPRIISPAAWQDLVAGKRSDAAETLVAALAAAG